MATPGNSALLILIIGIAVWMFGYGIWRVALVVTGGLYGYFLGTRLMATQNEQLAVVMGIVVAVLLAVLAYFLWSVIAIVYGMLLGAAIGSWIALTLNLQSSESGVGLFTIIGGAAGLILALLIKDQVIMLLTALSGAGTILFAAQPFLPAAWGPLTNPNDNVAALFVWIVLGALGYLIQSALFGTRRTNSYAGYHRRRGTSRTPRAA